MKFILFLMLTFFSAFYYQHFYEKSKKNEPIKDLIQLDSGVIFKSQHQIPKVEFTTHLGDGITEDSFQGHWSLFFFGYSNCPEFCPTIVKAMDEIGKYLNYSDMNYYFVSIDPLNDTPERLKDFLSDYKTPIIGLSGEYDQMHNLSSFFKLTVEKAENQERHIEHSASLVLVSPSGYPIALITDYKNPKKIAKDIRFAQYYAQHHFEISDEKRRSF
jgi:protein SCO1